jgi:hypothetical protein
MAFDDEKAVSEARSEQLVARAMARAGAGRPLRRPRSALVVGFSVVLLMVVALGLTSASTLPGDSLYGVSRAYEEVGGWIGVGDPVERRLNEVIALAERGDGVRAAQAATEALEALEQTTEFTPDLTTVTTLPSPEGSGGESTQETTPTTAPSSASVDASPVANDDDSVQTLKLAAELLLSRVQDNGGEVSEAAASLAQAVDDLVEEEDPVTAEGTSTTTTEPEDTSTTIIPDSTTTTEPEDTSTTTTVPDSTTTTEPEEGEGEAGNGKGPIFIPPQP